MDSFEPTLKPPHLTWMKWYNRQPFHEAAHSASRPEINRCRTTIVWNTLGTKGLRNERWVRPALGHKRFVSFRESSGKLPVASGNFTCFLSSKDELVGRACIGQGSDSQGQVIQKYVPPTLKERKPLSSYRESEFDETWNCCINGIV